VSSLSVQGLAVAYGRTEAVRGIDLVVSEGQVVCLIGANGAGKTTIMRALSGLVRPRAGSIRLDGVDITAWTPHRIAAAGMRQVPEGRQIFAELTVADNLALGAWLVSDRGEIARRREAVLSRFPRLRERLGQQAGSLSGGEQQMLALGRALMGAPRLLLLDEPSMGLAPLFVDEIFSIIAGLKCDGITILLVEQNASAALEVADTAYVLETGRIVLEGPAAVVANDPAVAAAYLGGRGRSRDAYYQPA
jgi:branched-chain amino acid transport system ATP-binding protein